MYKVVMKGYTRKLLFKIVLKTDWIPLHSAKKYMGSRKNTDLYSDELNLEDK